MSFRKIQKAKQRPHRERAQPLEREHLGILEKKKDYKIRSNHFKNKEQQLKALKKKAKERNPDEFHFDMINNQMKDGVHYVKNAHEVTTTEAQEKLLKTQDLRYINLKIQQEKKRITKLEEEIQILTATPDPKIHYLFYESKSDKLKKQELLQEKEMKFKAVTKKVSKLENVLVQRRKRMNELKVTRDKMEVHKRIHNDKKQAFRTKVSNETKNCAAVYKWEKCRTK